MDLSDLFICLGCQTHFRAVAFTFCSPMQGRARYVFSADVAKEIIVMRSPDHYLVFSDLRSCAEHAHWSLGFMAALSVVRLPQAVWLTDLHWGQPHTEMQVCLGDSYTCCLLYLLWIWFMDIFISSSYISHQVTHTQWVFLDAGSGPACNAALPLGVPNMIFLIQNFIISINFVSAFLNG